MAKHPASTSHNTGFREALLKTVRPSKRKKKKKSKTRTGVLTDSDRRRIQKQAIRGVEKSEAVKAAERGDRISATAPGLLTEVEFERIRERSRKKRNR